MSLQSFFGFGPSLDIELVLDGQDTRKTAEIKAEDGKIETHYLYYDGETIGGKVFVSILIYVFQYKEPSVPKMTYYVSVGTLNLTRSLTHTHAKASNTLIDNFFTTYSLIPCLVAWLSMKNEANVVFAFQFQNVLIWGSVVFCKKK